MVRKVSADQLQTVFSELLQAVKAPSDLADEVAAVLVDNQLAGHDSHGAVRMSEYMQKVQDGVIDPQARPKLIKDTVSTAVVDGQWGFGQVAASHATEILIEKVLESGVATVSIIQANHTGRLAAWTERAARRGVVMFMAIGTVGHPLMAPFGGAGAALGTNPVAFSIPNHEGAPITLDYATSAIANGKLLVARSEAAEVPEGAIVTKDGQPTTNPEDYFNGGFLLPFGAHKGYALAVIAELLGTVVTGAGRREGVPQSGVFMFGIAHDAFRTSESYQAELDATLDRIISVKPAAGFDEVLLPGMVEDRARRKRTNQGITLPDAMWENLVTLGMHHDVDVSAIVASDVAAALTELPR